MNARPSFPSRAAHAIAILALLAAPPLAAQQPGERSYRDESTMPEGLVGQRIEATLEAFNAGTPAALERFLAEHATSAFRSVAPLEEHRRIWAGQLRRWGPVRFHGLRTYDPPRPSETVVIVRDGHFDAWRAITLQLEPDGERRVDGMSFNDARPPTNVAEEALPADELVPEIERLVRRSCEVDAFSGTVLVARGTAVLYAHGCGEASKRFGVPVDLETRFNLGSMNKMFTSVAILQLVEEGLVSLDAPLSEYVDATWLPREVTSGITIHHLLTHTSGLGSYFNERFMESSRASFRALEDYKPLLRDERPAFEPGTDWRYSNTGMFLLGVVIESATGDSYFDVIRERIYEPAGMTRTDSYEMDKPVDNLAIGYDPLFDAEWGYENNLYKHVIKGGPAGGGFSTVGDLHRFAQALVSAELLSPASLELLWTDHHDRDYGYGFTVLDAPAGRIVGHSGGFSGISANLDMYLDRDLVVAVLSNYGGAATPIAAGVRGLVARVTVDTGAAGDPPRAR